jgi:hypothetical protein
LAVSILKSPDFYIESGLFYTAFFASKPVMAWKCISEVNYWNINLGK